MARSERKISKCQMHQGNMDELRDAECKCMRCGGTAVRPALRIHRTQMPAIRPAHAAIDLRGNVVLLEPIASEHPASGRVLESAGERPR